jgi:drug/metabolite transporter (DMT)-like permease
MKERIKKNLFPVCAFVLSLISALFWVALRINHSGISKFLGADTNPSFLVMNLPVMVTVLAWICVFLGNAFPTAFPMDAVSGIVYLGLIATAMCMFLQSYGLKYAEPAIGGMIISLESVFGVVFSVIIYHEKITLRMLIGFAVIFAAILLSQGNSYQKIQEQVDISTATIGRVSKCLNYGSGGYRTAIEKLKED